MRKVGYSDFLPPQLTVHVTLVPRCRVYHRNFPFGFFRRQRFIRNRNPPARLQVSMDHGKLHKWEDIIGEFSSSSMYIALTATPRVNMWVTYRPREVPVPEFDYSKPQILTILFTKKKKFLMLNLNYNLIVHEKVQRRNLGILNRRVGLIGECNYWDQLLKVCFLVIILNKFNF